MKWKIVTIMKTILISTNIESNTPKVDKVITKSKSHIIIV